MLLKVTAPLVGFDGSPFTDGATLRSVIVNALAGMAEGEQLTGEQKLERYRLAKKIHVEDEAKLRAEDVVLVKAVVAAAYGPLVVGQVFEALEA